MIFKEINLLQELRATNDKVVNQLVQSAYAILNNDSTQEQKIQSRLKSKSKGLIEQHNITLLDKEQIFTLDAIKDICIKYRLRFLDSTLFKDQIPVEAISKIKRLERLLNQEVSAFKIIAPAQKFILKDSMLDPILMAEMADGRFYFIHQWGEDLSLSRKILSYPFRNLESLGLTVLSIAFLLVAVLPNNALPEFYHRTFALLLLAKGMLFFALTGFLFTLSLIFGIVSIKDFSESNWNNKYFN